MQNEIIINAEPGETRVAVLERSLFSELHIERDKDRSVVGSIVKGRVTRVLPGMQAAFVDIGLDKAAFLYAGDYFANEFTEGAEEVATPPRRGRDRQPPRIDTLLKEGQEIVVQIAKQPIGSKGARIISHVSIPGRHLVLTPWSPRVGVSRRIGSDRERRRLREIIERLRPKNLGFIIRTAGDGVREADLEADIRYLASVWERIGERNSGSRAPAVLHSEPDLPLRMIRDFSSTETKRIVVDSETSFDAIRSFMESYVADPKPSIEHYQGREPIFDAFGLESQVDANLGRKVFLKSGGSLVVDHGEAMTMIDVNTGRYVGKRDLEDTVFKTNLEAVKEVVHQLRFRNIGGLIIIDLIDMESADNREKVYRALQEALRADKSRTNIFRISELGLIEMTRKRTRENLVQTLCEPCAYCNGRGYVLGRESVAFRVVREIRKDLPRFCGRRIALSVAPQVAEELLRSSPSVLEQLGDELGREIEVRARPGLHQEQFEVEGLDPGPPVDVPLSWLSDSEEPEAAGAEAKISAGGLPEGAEKAPEADGDSGEAEEPIAADLAAEPHDLAAEPPPVESPSPEASETASGEPESNSERSPGSLEPEAEAVDAATESRILRSPMAPEAASTVAEPEASSAAVATDAAIADAPNPEPGER
jgi:ribonuclease G